MSGKDQAAAIRVGAPPASARRPRFVLLAIILGVAGLLYAGIRNGLDDNAYKFLATLALVFLNILALWLWVAFGAGLSPVARKRVLIGGVAVIALLIGFRFAALKRVGYTGDMHPVYAWRWEAPSNAAVVANVPTQRADRSSTAESNKDLLKADYRYPQFLGPDRHPVLKDVALARNWTSSPPKLVWKKPIGDGWSAFSVYGELAVTEEQRGEQECVVCYHWPTGREVWIQSHKARFSETMGGDGPRATPTIFEDGEPKVCTLGALGALNCFRLADGEPVWPTRNILDDAGAQNLQWAMAGSPLVYDDLIVVNPGGTDGKSLAAYDRNRGEPRWSAGNSPTAYCSPTLMTLCGRRQVVIVNQLDVTAHDADSGEVLWKHEWPGNQPKVAQPVAVGNDRVFCSTGYGIGCMLLKVEQSSDGKFTVTNLYDGRNGNMKTKISNVAIENGHVYGLDDGVMECLELDTGDRRWKEGRFGHGQILLVGEVILVLAENGELVMLDVNPDEYAELGRIQALTGKTWNNPALAGNFLLIRNDQEAACYELPLAQIEAPDSSSDE